MKGPGFPAPGSTVKQRISHSCESSNLPDDFRITIDIVEDGYRLETFQSFPIPRQRAFCFFENPGNLSAITPDWLDFRMVAKTDKVFAGAEYDYHIRWFGLELRWRSRISVYNPPYDFTDVQIVGPYTKWEHMHRFEEDGGRTVMQDTVVYKIPFSGLGRVVHWLLVKNQLRDIFCHRAIKIMEWVRREQHEEARSRGKRETESFKSLQGPPFP